jgi:alcohol dehydrogenase, propanol-preferring
MATLDIPKQQKAAVRVGKGAEAKAPVKDMDVRMPGPSEVLVKINWSVHLLEPL